MPNAQQEPSIDQAFENACHEAVTKPNLTLRQQLWIAFNAGGQYAIKSIAAVDGVDALQASHEPR
jgi:hypothetical protein